MTLLQLENQNFLPLVPASLRVKVLRDLSVVQNIAGQFIGKLNVEIKPILAILEESFYENDQRFSEATTLQWADNFSFPLEVYTTDLNGFIRGGNDLSSLVKLRQEVSREGRLNHSRIINLKIVESEWKIDY